MPNEDATNTNAPRWVKVLLTNEWTPTIADRSTDVPQPVIGTGKEIPSISSSQILSDDYLIISTPAASNRVPQGFEYTEEQVTDRVTLDIRTISQRGGSQRLHGDVDPATMRSERYSGLVGEAIRCLQTIRRGEGDYDYVNVIEVEPLSGEMGKKTHRATIEIELVRMVVGVDSSV